MKIFLNWKKKKKKNEKIIEKQRYITIKNKQEREWMKREMKKTKKRRMRKLQKNKDI